MRDSIASTKLNRILEKCALAVLVFFGLFTIAYFVLAELFLPSEADREASYCETFAPDWYQVLSDGSAIPAQIPGTVPSEDGEQVVVTCTLPENFLTDSYLVFRSSKQDMRFLIDGSQIYSYDTTDSRWWGQTSAVRYLLIPMKPEYQGRTLQVVSTSKSGFVGNFSEVFYANYTGYWLHVLHTQGAALFVGAFMLIAGVFSLLMGMAVTIVYRRSQKLNNISAGVILLATWILCNSAFRQLIFPNVSVISDMTYIVITVIPIPFARFMDLMQNRRYHTLYLTVESATALDAIILLVLHITGVFDYPRSFYVNAAFLFLIFASIVMTLTLDTITKKVREYRASALAILLATLFSVGQLVVYITSNTTFDFSLAALSTLVMLVIAFIDTVKDITAMINEKTAALEASSLKSQFLANMSHEIRTPINAILGMNELILEESSEPMILSYATDVENSSKALLSLINDILDFSKIESGKMDLVLAPYNLRSLLDRLALLTTTRIGDKPVTFSIDADPDIPLYLLGDENRLQQIVLNLLTNAVKYTDEGSITLTIRQEPSANGTILLSFSVKDTGRGIKEEDLPKLFDSFQRLDQQKNRSIEGTGLGLAITKLLVTLMHGTIRVSSTYNEGSEFTATAQQALVAEHSEKLLPYAVSKTHPEQQNHKKILLTDLAMSPADIHVLVVDDVPMNLKVFQGLLKNTGIQIDAVSSGAEALALWKQKTYSIVFLDHMMPEMDGVECAHLMWQQREFNPTTPVIMLTANAISGMKEWYLQAGFTDYLSKPFQATELRDMIEKYIEPPVV